MKKITALLLVFSFVPVSGVLFSEKRGAELRIQKTDGSFIRAELILVKEDSLVLEILESGATMSLDLQEISIIDFQRRTSLGLVSIGGFLLGGALGGYTGAHANDSDDKDLVLMLGLIGAVTFGILSGQIARAISPAKRIDFEGMSESERGSVLEKLRSKARVQERF